LLNPNRTFNASYDQTLYEQIIPPLHLLDGTDWQLVCAGFNRNSDCQPNSSDGRDSRDSSNLNSSASVNSNDGTECAV